MPPRPTNLRSPLWLGPLLLLACGPEAQAPVVATEAVTAASPEPTKKKDAPSMEARAPSKAGGGTSTFAA